MAVRSADRKGGEGALSRDALPSLSTLSFRLPYFVPHLRRASQSYRLPTPESMVGYAVPREEKDRRRNSPFPLIPT
jgi:hypothetical protein